MVSLINEKKMSKYQKIVAACLIAIAIEGAVTAALLVRMMRDGFSIDIELSEAVEIAKKINDARIAAEEDMSYEKVVE